MPKPRRLDAKLARLHALRREPAGPDDLAMLREALGDKSNLVVADAAEIVGERVLTELEPDLAEAFDRFMVDPSETDKLCRAKTAIVEALNKLEYDKEQPFLAGIHHVQMEPRWGREEDTAARLRGSSAFGLVRINYHDVILLLVDLLADDEHIARSAAAQAFGASRLPAAIPLLRFKARTGDKESSVTADCLSALMTAAPKESLAFVAECLDAGDESVQEGAALALGESRLPEAFEILRKQWTKERHGDLQEVILLAISMTRLSAALDFLVELLASDDKAVAPVVLYALAIHKHNGSLKQRIATIVASKQDALLQMRFEKKFSATE